MMDDLISRSAALELFPKDMEKPLWHFTGVRAALEQLPSVDAVPVVRCKECKHRGTPNCLMFHTEYSWDEDDGTDIYDVDRTDDDGFCHKGAHMDAEETTNGNQTD